MIVTVAFSSSSRKSVEVLMSILNFSASFELSEFGKWSNHVHILCVTAVNTCYVKLV